MPKIQAMLFGALLTVAGAGLLHLVQPAAAMGNGPYQLMHHSNTSANAGVFRMDTSTGAVSYCYMSDNNALNCTGEVR